MPSGPWLSHSSIGVEGDEHIGRHWSSFAFGILLVTIYREPISEMQELMSHESVVKLTWMIVVVAKSACGMKNGTATAVTSDITMATTSHQADTRHQNQRAM